MGILGTLLAQAVAIDGNNQVVPTFDYKSMIPKEEGYEADFYEIDGKEHIGYGHKVNDRKKFKDLNKRLGIKAPLSQEHARILLNHDISSREQSLNDKYPDLTPTAKSLVFDYYYNTGPNSRGFKRMLEFAREEDYTGMEKYLREEAIPYYKEKKLGGVARRRKKLADFIKNNLIDTAPVSMLGGQ